jgi:hypothetical protein
MSINILKINKIYDIGNTNIKQTIKEIMGIK